MKFKKETIFRLLLPLLLSLSACKPSGSSVPAANLDPVVSVARPEPVAESLIPAAKLDPVDRLEALIKAVPTNTPFYISKDSWARLGYTGDSLEQLAAIDRCFFSVKLFDVRKTDSLVSPFVAYVDIVEKTITPTSYPKPGSESTNFCPYRFTMMWQKDLITNDMDWVIKDVQFLHPESKTWRPHKPRDHPGCLRTLKAFSSLKCAIDE